MEYKIYSNPGVIEYAYVSKNKSYYVDQLSPKLTKVNGKSMQSYIKSRYNLSLRRYFNIIVMYDVNYQPKCPVCGNPVKFNRLTRGYFETCSNYCNNKLRVQRNTHNLQVGNYDWKSDAKSARTLFRMKGRSNDRCLFYICKANDERYKYGVTKNLNGRMIISKLHSNKDEIDYNSPIFLLKSTRYNVSELEYQLKIHLKDNHEYFHESKLSEVLEFIKEFK